MCNNVESLIEKLNDIERKNLKDLLTNIEQRKLEEIEFFNREHMEGGENNSDITKSRDCSDCKKRYETTILSRNYINNQIKKYASDAICLDYGCGNGMNAINMAKQNAALSIGLDISDISIKNAKNTALHEGVVGNTFFIQGDCENTGLDNNCIDFCTCISVLHHLDLKNVFPELHRVMRTGGRILAMEALNYNPIIKRYRMRTPKMRTEWEKTHILSYNELKLAKSFGFRVENVKHWHLFSILGTKTPKLLPLLNNIDQIILNIPGLKLMSWMFTFELVKE